MCRSFRIEISDCVGEVLTLQQATARGIDLEDQRVDPGRDGTVDLPLDKRLEQAIRTQSGMATSHGRHPARVHRGGSTGSPEAGPLPLHPARARTLTAPTLHPSLDPACFAEPAARDERFTVVDVWMDCVNLPDAHAEKANEFFHWQMNEEAAVLENAARSLYEFPEADWDLRMWLARQCADEARHTDNDKRLLLSRGGRIGQYPVLSFQYRIMGRVDTLIGRLAVENRSFEADGLDAVTNAIVEAGAPPVTPSWPRCTTRSRPTRSCAHPLRQRVDQRRGRAQPALADGDGPGTRARREGIPADLRT